MKNISKSLDKDEDTKKNWLKKLKNHFPKLVLIQRKKTYPDCKVQPNQNQYVRS